MVPRLFEAFNQFPRPSRNFRGPLDGQPPAPRLLLNKTAENRRRFKSHLYAIGRFAPLAAASVIVWNYLGVQPFRHIRPHLGDQPDRHARLPSGETQLSEH